MHFHDERVLNMKEFAEKPTKILTNKSLLFTFSYLTYFVIPDNLIVENVY